MKFETPIAEVELFELKDVISASNTTTVNPAIGYMNEPNCIYNGDARDNENFNECL